jgi:hypothetical protein
MIFRALADLVVVLHLGFIVFVVAGGLPALRWRWWPWLHLPAVAWGAALELGGLHCPLTPLERWLRHRAGDVAHEDGFVDHYLLPLVYPGALTREIQIVLGVGVLVANAIVYAVVIRRRGHRWRGGDHARE